MALDNGLLLYTNSAFVLSNAINIQSTAFALGRTGLPANAQFYTSIQNASVGPKDLTIDLLLSLDGNITNGRIIARHVYKATWKGTQTTGISRDFNTQEYADANIVLGINAFTASANEANNTNLGLLKAYISVGEKTRYGRKSTADTLATP